MPDSSYDALSDAVFTVLVQIYGAFAQGADGVFVDDEVILAARKDYAPVIERDLAYWPEEAARILALTRVMGRMAAHRALGEGSATINLKHYRNARRALHVARCPFHLRRRK